MIKPLLIWLKQRYCVHFVDLDDMKRRDDMLIECPCYKCGKILVAEYGLALPAQWGKNPSPKKRYTHKQILETAEKMGIHGHCFITLEEFGYNIAEYIEHPERIVLAEHRSNDANFYLHYALPNDVVNIAISKK